MSSKKRLSLKRKLVEKVVEYEPRTPLSLKDFKEFGMVKLVRMMRQNFHSDWNKYPYTEHYYCGC